MSPRRERRPLWRRLVWPAAILAAANALVFLAYTLPRLFQVRNVTQRGTEVRQELEGQRKMTEALRGLSEAVRANATDTQRFYSEVVITTRNPERPLVELIPLIEDVERMAAEPGLKASTRGYTPVHIEGADITRWHIGFSLEGNYQQLVRFIDQVEKSPRFLTIDRIAFSPDAERGSANLRVELSAYMRGKVADDRGRRRG